MLGVTLVEDGNLAENFLPRLERRIVGVAGGKGARELKLPVSVLDAIEREDWARLGAPIFVRSYVGSYAKLLGLPASLADEVVKGKPAPQLVSIAGTPVRPSRMSSGRVSAYLPCHGNSPCMSCKIASGFCWCPQTC